MGGIGLRDGIGRQVQREIDIAGGESVEARCYHHQAIAELGEGLVVSGWDADGVVEALELPGNDFVLAVQWHPEESLDDLRLFSAIVDAAQTYAGKERHR